MNSRSIEEKLKRDIRILKRENLQLKKENEKLKRDKKVLGNEINTFTDFSR